MINSARVHGMDVTPYAIGPMGSPHGGDIQGSWMIEMLKTRSEPYVISVDAPDVLFMTGEEEILEKFKSLGCGFLCSAESASVAPVADIVERLDQFPGRHKHPNIGCWVGERQCAIDTIQKSMDLYRHKPIVPHFDLDSAGAWLAYGRAYGTIDYGLDVDSVVFQSASGWSRADMELKEKDGRLRMHNIVTGTWPCVVHYNGTRNDAVPYGPFLELSAQLYGM
jgi:hypothetical protein